MINLRRIALLAALTMAVPVSALALEGGTAPAAGGLAVSASLNGCTTGSEEVQCSIGVSFGGLAGAAYYTASVTRPDGGVQDFGQVGAGAGGGGAELSVPYVGAGTYTVHVSAYGSPPGIGSAPLDEAEAGA